MKKTFKRSLALLLSLLMIFSVAPAYAMAADEVIEGEVEVVEIPAPTFSFVKVSETDTELVMALNLTENGFNCFEIQVAAGENLVLNKIDIDSSFDSKSNNVSNGKIAIATLETCAAPLTVATYTFEKLNKITTLARDFTLTVATCYVGEADNEANVTEGVTVTIELPTEHVHVPGKLVITVDPTCGAEGVAVRYCTECGEIAETETLDKREHGETTPAHKDPTCTEVGYDKEVCNKCGQDVSYTEIPAINHANKTPDNKDATCTEPGYTSDVCDDCGEVFNYVEIPATNHANKKDVHVDPSCAAPGYDKKVCEDCGESFDYVEIPALEHTKDVERVESTCSEAGYVKVFCKVCNEIFSNDPLPLADHKNKETVTVNPTCTEAGYTQVVCKDCNTVISTTPIAATGHLNKTPEHKDPTCTEVGYDKEICNDCGQEVSYTEIAKLPHKAADTDVKAAECLVDGYIRTICSCGHIMSEKILERTGHNYYDDSHPSTCTESGYKRKVCRYCQDIQPGTTTPPTGHKWLAWTTIKEPTVSSEGIKRRVCESCGADEEKTIAKLVVSAKEVVLTTDEVTMNYNATLRLFANILPEDAAYSTVLYWESSDPKVATVDEEGQVHATGLGTATITVRTANGKTDTCTVTVKYSMIQWIIVYVLFGWIWYL